MNEKSAFPLMGNGPWERGMTMRDYFAAHAPLPTEDEIRREMALDSAKNPHNDRRGPMLRSRHQIIATLAYKRADAMLAAREVRSS